MTSGGPEEVIAGRYEVEGAVGSGGMATVYRARDTLLERTVALKVLDERHAADPEFVARFRDEARAAARLQHPNVVGVIDRFEDDGREVIVYEFVTGETLKDLVGREGPLPVAEVVRLGLGVARALAAAHEQGIVHRDVKPQNVLLGEDGRARVTDFGIAHGVGADERTMIGAVLGTAAYLPPEQARGERGSASGDVYSLGCLLYELLAGRPPFDGASFVEVAMRHVEQAPPDLREPRPECPPALAELVERCLAKEAPERPTAADVLRVLSSLAATPEPEAAPTIVIPSRVRHRRPVPRRGRRRVVLLLAAALIAALAVGGVVLLGDGGGSSAAGGPVVRFAAARSYDPEGTGGEHDELLSRAIDGDRRTYWTTEGYRSFTKSGVGLVLDAGRPVALRELTVVTDLPGWTAEVKAGASPESFPESVGGERTVGAVTRFSLDGGEARYYLLWITSVVSDGTYDRAHVNEVTAR